MIRALPSALNFLRKSSLALLALICGASLYGQSLNGNAFVTSPGCFQLTADSPWQSGSVYFPDTLNLNRPFDFLMEFNFGIKDLNGADGIVFVLQNEGPNELGPAGGSLGWFGVPNSLGIEFDTYQNPVNDPVYDHISVFRDGEIDHALPNHLMGPVSALPGNGNIEDGQDHLVQITWDPSDLVLNVYFDCSLKISMNIDLVNTIFAGDSLVHWGVSAAGGGAFNRHTFCLLPNEAGSILDTFALCGGDTTTLTAPPSRDGVYQWSPAYNQAGGNNQSLEVWPGQDTFYTVNYIDPCGIQTLDTIVFRVRDPLPVDLGSDTAACIDSTILLDLPLPGGTFLWSTGSTDSSIVVDTAGMYSVIAMDSFGCVYSDSQSADFVLPPMVYAGLDITDCNPSQPHILMGSPIAPNTDYYWSTGDSTPILEVNASGDYILYAANGCSTATDTVIVFLYEYEEGYFIPNVFSPNGDGINDAFRIENFRQEEFFLVIFDRWGNEVYSSRNSSDTWDGNVRGGEAPEGVYYFKLRVRDCQGFPTTENGTITLVR